LIRKNKKKGKNFIWQQFFGYGGMEIGKEEGSFLREKRVNSQNSAGCFFKMFATKMNQTVQGGVRRPLFVPAIHSFPLTQSAHPPQQTTLGLGQKDVARPEPRAVGQTKKM
jgi:hypothetical protein